jgi:hypothetical protein
MSYADKDARKAKAATQFIGYGTPGSSTERYRVQWGSKANTGMYNDSDVVFVSVNGNRPHRVHPPLELITKAVKANAVIITDNPYHRQREYNVGEREVAAHLKSLGCFEVAHYHMSIWTLPSN